MARTNLRAWGLESRVKVEIGDIREKVPNEPFDIATLYNNIYYLPMSPEEPKPEKSGIRD